MHEVFYVSSSLETQGKSFPQRARSVLVFHAPFIVSECVCGCLNGQFVGPD